MVNVQVEHLLNAATVHIVLANITEEHAQDMAVWHSGISKSLNTEALQIAGLFIVKN